MEDEAFGKWTYSPRKMGKVKERLERLDMEESITSRITIRKRVTQPVPWPDPYRMASGEDEINELVLEPNRRK